MKKFKETKSIAAYIDRKNIDTDAIIPKQYLKAVTREGFGETLFDDWRYLEPGNLGDDHSQRKKNPEFFLYDSKNTNAQILVAGDNFGCGSSREHAPWGLQDWGFDAIISTKFADIFRLNSINIGLVPIETSKEIVDGLFTKIEADPSTNIEISIENKTVQCEEIAFSFDLDDFSQKRILEGLDKIDITLGYTDQIDSFSKSRKKWMPKLA